MLEIKKFKYHDKLRECVVLNPGQSSIRGIELTLCESDEEREKIRKIAETIDITDKKDEALMVETQKLVPYFKYFRHYKLNQIVE